MERDKLARARGRRRRESGVNAQPGYVGLVFMRQSAGEEKSRGLKHLHQVHPPFFSCLNSTALIRVGRLNGLGSQF
jgi:hypothetical protein